MGRHMVLKGCAGFVDSPRFGRLLTDGRGLDGTDSLKDYCPRSR